MIYKQCQKFIIQFRMSKTTNILVEKPFPIGQIQRIKFDLNPSNYKCFISNAQKIQTNIQLALAQDGCNQQEKYNRRNRKKISDLKIPSIRRNIHVNITRDLSQYREQVLVMQYNKDEVYIDSIKNGQQQQNQFDTKSVNSQISEQNQMIQSCVKVLNDDTDTDSSSAPGYLHIQQAQLSSHFPVYYSNYRNQNPQINTFAIQLQKTLFDGRTTIMIRNIPNKYTQNLLLDLFNKNHRNKIDFFYLPIDPKNNCNVGYAFLNFIHPKFIEEFYNEFHNKKWKLFNSQKICHICYARIQGTAQLSHHFYPACKKARDSPK